jgi:hypothetical protein
MIVDIVAKTICRLFCFLLSFFFPPFYCLISFELRLLITPLLSPNFSYIVSMYLELLSNRLTSVWLVVLGLTSGILPTSTRPHIPWGQESLFCHCCFIFILNLRLCLRKDHTNHTLVSLFDNTLYCQFLWIFHLWLPLRYSLMFIYLHLPQVIKLRPTYVINSCLNSYV